MTCLLNISELLLSAVSSMRQKKKTQTNKKEMAPRYFLNPNSNPEVHDASPPQFIMSFIQSMQRLGFLTDGLASSSYG